jgi:KaiC/GvpD/RAD55 family RecA-like ATPase
MPSKKELSDVKIMEILGPNRDIDLRVETALSDFDEESSTLVLMKKEQYEKRLARLVKYFTHKNYICIFIAINKSSSELNNIFKKEGILQEKMFYIDAVSTMTDTEKLKGKQVIHIDSPGNLLDLNIAIEQAVKKINEKKKVLIMDSLTTLIVYSSEAAVEKFIHSISQKINEWKLPQVILAMDSTDTKVIDTLSQFCGKVSDL